ncbi:hypothetical protein ASE99_24300 [Serratia sp. Leaf51]|nr:hypothetical protein ASE99_24300 [Serratia sp. Leaf51]
MTMTADVAGTPLKRGERVWVVADGGNLEAVAAQTGSSPKFDEVITDQTIPVQAGAALGHLGFFQIPTDLFAEQLDVRPYGGAFRYPPRPASARAIWCTLNA